MISNSQRQVTSRLYPRDCGIKEWLNDQLGLADGDEGRNKPLGVKDHRVLLLVVRLTLDERCSS